MAAKNADKIGQRVKRLTKKLAEEFRDAKLGLRPSPRKEGKDEIEYETGFDPATGEIKGPDIDINEVTSSSFVEREVLATVLMSVALTRSTLSLLYFVFALHPLTRSSIHALAHPSTHSLIHPLIHQIAG